MKITKEDLLNSEFLKQFKDSGELDGFLSELHKRGIENTRGIHRRFPVVPKRTSQRHRGFSDIAVCQGHGQ
jgi:hypothetical protein